jgi:tetratricopeptide (TPR) repeat protein
MTTLSRSYDARLAWLLGLALSLPAPAAHADDSRTEARAAALFEEGAKQYRAGDFDKAIALFGEAHSLVQEPVLLFNLAKAFEGKGALQDAIDAYEQYLRDAKDVGDRGALEARVESLRAQLETRKTLEMRANEAKRRAERAEQERRNAERAPSPVPWIIAGVGVAGIATGIGVGALANKKEDEALAEPVQRDAEALKGDAEDLALAANVTFALAGTVALGGLIWGIVDVATVEPPEVSVEPSSTGATFRLLLFW